MERQTPAYLRDLRHGDRKRNADISAWIIRDRQDIVRFLSEGVEPDIDHYDEFKGLDELEDFITGKGDYDGLFVNQEDLRRSGGDYDPDVVLEHSEQRRSSHRLDAEERIEETLELYSEENDDAWLEYTEVSHE